MIEIITLIVITGFGAAMLFGVFYAIYMIDFADDEKVVKKAKKAKSKTT